MRNTLLASAALLGMALALPAVGQTATDPNPANPSAIKDSTTPAAGTGSGAAPGSDPIAASKTGASLGASAPTTGPGPLGNQQEPSATPSGGSSSSSSPTPDSAGSSGSGTTPRHNSMSSNTSGGRMGGSGHWAHQPGTGESGPASSQASNIDDADTHSTIAPHLPSPKLGQNAGPERYLQVAERALRAHKTGEAQQALEMAETRLLDRSTEPGSAGQPDQDPRIAAVSSARKDLAAKNWTGARHSIQMAMNSRGEGAESNGSQPATTDTTTTTTGSSPSSMAPGTGMSPGGAGTTSTMAHSGSNHGVAGGNPGATPAPLDPSAQGPASTGAAGTPSSGANATVPNPIQPASGAK